MICIHQYESIISFIATRYSHMTIVQLNDQVNQKLAELQKQVMSSKKTTDLVKYLEDSKNTIVCFHCSIIHSLPLVSHAGVLYGCLVTPCCHTR